MALLSKAELQNDSHINKIQEAWSAIKYKSLSKYKLNYFQ